MMLCRLKQARNKSEKFKSNEENVEKKKNKRKRKQCYHRQACGYSK